MHQLYIENTSYCRTEATALFNNYFLAFSSAAVTSVTGRPIYSCVTSVSAT